MWDLDSCCCLLMVNSPCSCRLLLASLRLLLPFLWKHGFCCHENWSTFNAYWTSVPDINNIILCHSKWAGNRNIWHCKQCLIIVRAGQVFSQVAWEVNYCWWWWLRVTGSETSLQAQLSTSAKSDRLGLWLTMEITSPLLQENLQKLELAALFDCSCGWFAYSLRSSDFMNVPCILLVLIGRGTYSIFVIVFQKVTQYAFCC